MGHRQPDEGRRRRCQVLRRRRDCRPGRRRSAIAAFRAAEAPVYAALEADPRREAGDRRDPGLAPRRRRRAASRRASPVIDGSELGARWRHAAEWHLSDRGDGGVPPVITTPTTSASSVGIYDFTLDGRTLVSSSTPAPGGGTDHQEGIYRVEGRRHVLALGSVLQPPEPGPAPEVVGRRHGGPCTSPSCPGRPTGRWRCRSRGSAT